MKRHRRDYEMMTEMNLTNLLDTAFVLLIAFIMASPTMRPSGLHVDLPDVAQATDTLKTDQQNKPVTITIKKSENGLPEMIYVEGENRVSLEPDAPQSLLTYIQGKKSMNPTQKLDVIIEMDKEARYDYLAKVLAILRAEGIDGVGLPMATEPPAPVNAAAKKADTTKKTDAKKKTSS